MNTHHPKKQTLIENFVTKTPNSLPPKETHVEAEAPIVQTNSIKNFFSKKSAKNMPQKVLTIDISQDDRDILCEKCDESRLATHFCNTCGHNLCKYCIIDHYKNSTFIKDHDMVPLKR